MMLSDSSSHTPAELANDYALLATTSNPQLSVVSGAMPSSVSNVASTTTGTPNLSMAILLFAGLVIVWAMSD